MDAYVFTHFSLPIFSGDSSVERYMWNSFSFGNTHSLSSKEKVTMETVWSIGERHFVPITEAVGVSESATNLYLPHPGLRRDHYQSFLLNCGSSRSLIYLSTLFTWLPQCASISVCLGKKFYKFLLSYERIPWVDFW